MKSDLKSGFTLLEMLVALAIVAIAMTIVWQTFSVTIKAWRKGSDFLADMHHGDFVMEQLSEGLRSAAYFDGSGNTYGFRLENREDGKYPNDKLSWVKSGHAFLPHSSKIGRGLHRIDLTVADNDEGDPAVFARIYPHLATEDDEEIYEGETWEISGVVKGIDCRVYNEEDEDWSDEWEDTNSIPALIEITLFMDPLEGDDKPVEVKRAIQIPISRELKSGVIFNEAGKEAGQAGATAPAVQPNGASGAASRSRMDSSRNRANPPRNSPNGIGRENPRSNPSGATAPRAQPPPPGRGAEGRP